MTMKKIITRSIESLPSTPTKFTKCLPGDIYTTNITENEVNNLMRTSRPVHNAVYSFVYPEKLPDPELLAISPASAQEIELDLDEVKQNDSLFVSVFSGNKILPSTRPWSLCYAGHQFGYFAGQLGDGRAISLFETINSKGKSWELQLKGAGKTPYSRFGDGYAVLRSSIREFLMSEHMNALGVPTTRALGLIGSSREVYREEPEQGAVVVRMASSWLRFGNFEMFYSRDDMNNVKRLTDYAIDHVIEPEEIDVGEGNRYTRFFRNVTIKTARMIAEWQAIGFNHGVMNTDNMSILGLTMDYGPFQIMDYYDPHYICNHSDDSGRYAFQRQPSVAIFNLVKLSIPLFELLGAEDQVDSLVFPQEGVKDTTDDDTLESYRKKGQFIVQNILNNEFKDAFMSHLLKKMRDKIGLFPKANSAEDKSDMDDVIIPLLDWLTEYKVDYHRFYRSLSKYEVTDQGEEADATKAIESKLDIMLQDESIISACKTSLKPWLSIYRHRLLSDSKTIDNDNRRKRMNAVNPRFVLRNSIAEDVIKAFNTSSREEGKYMLNTCLDACLHPFEDQYENEQVEKWINQRVPDGVDLRCSCSS